MQPFFHSASSSQGTQHTSKTGCRLPPAIGHEGGGSISHGGRAVSQDFYGISHGGQVISQDFYGISHGGQVISQEIWGRWPLEYIENMAKQAK